MAARFRYSKWDGTQQGYELDADSVIKEVTDELIHHGDPNAALRRIMQQGLRDRNGKKIEGLRDTVAWYQANEWWWRPIKERDPNYKAYMEAQYGTR